MATRSRPSSTQRVGVRPTAITSIDERNPYKKWLIYSDSGAGKTVLAGTAPDNLFLEFDPEGTESAKQFGSTADALPIPNWREWQEALDYFKRGSGCRDYHWVTIDTLSEGEDTCWRMHLAAMHTKKPTTRSIYKPALDDYQIVWNMMKEVVEEFNRLPINVLYTCHVLAIDRWDEDREEEYQELMPLLGSTKTGILSRKICAKVGLVGHLDVRKRRNADEEVEEYRRLTVNKTRTMIAKNRYHWTSSIDNPTVPKLVALAEPAAPKPRRTRRSA
jgi:hypothetical protein